MSKLFKKSIIALFVVILSISIAPVSSYAEDHSGEATAASITGDILVLRPLGILATALGSVLFVAALPFAVLGNNVKQAADLTVAEPFKYTFMRPVGENISDD